MKEKDLIEFISTYSEQGMGLFQKWLDSDTLKLQKTMVIISCISILLTHSFITLTEVSQAGTKINFESPQAFNIMLALVIGYLLITFVINVYAQTKSHNLQRKKIAADLSKASQEIESQLIQWSKRINEKSTEITNMQTVRQELFNEDRAILENGQIKMFPISLTLSGIH